MVNLILEVDKVKIILRILFTIDEINYKFLYLFGFIILSFYY